MEKSSMLLQQNRFKIYIYLYIYIYIWIKPDMQDTAGEAETSSCGPPHMAGQKQDDQHEHTFGSYVRIRDVALKTCRRR